MRAKVDHVTDCVFLPAHAITRAGYTQFLRRSGWEAKTLFEEGVFTCVLAAPATLPLRRSRGGARLATPSGVSRAARSAVPCRSSAPGHRASRSKYTRDQSRETGSLSRLFGSMETAAKCVSMGHAHCRTRLCGALPQPFYGVTPMLVGPEQALIMEQEVSTLLREETIEVVPALDKESGFYSRTSLFLGKGLRPS